MFLANCRWRTGPNLDAIVDVARAASGERHDERVLQLSFLTTFASFGGLYADGAINRPDRPRPLLEQLHLEWWVGRARHALSSAWSPI